MLKINLKGLMKNETQNQLNLIILDFKRGNLWALWNTQQNLLLTKIEKESNSGADLERDVDQLEARNERGGRIGLQEQQQTDRRRNADRVEQRPVLPQGLHERTTLSNSFRTYSLVC